MATGSPFVEAWVEGPFATAFYTRLYRPPASAHTRAILVFAHGYLEHVGRYMYPEFHTAWAARGIAVFAYDERGFGRTALDEEHRSPGSAYGRTGGMKERMTDVEWAVKHAKGLVEDDIPASPTIAVSPKHVPYALPYLSISYYPHKPPPCTSGHHPLWWSQ